MKKIFYTAAMMLVSMTMSAQVFTVGSVDRVNTPVVAERVAISPDGSFLAAYAPAKGAIMRITPDGNTTEITRGEGLYDLKVTADGAGVVFTRPTFDKNHLRKISLEAANVESGDVTVLVKPSRHLNAGVSLAGSTVTAVENGRAKVKSLGADKANATPVASINYGHLDVTVNGKTTSIDPQGRGSYIWPSISPDGTKVVYWLVGSGCYVCNLDGSDSKRLGRHLLAPVWAGNDVIIGMAEKDGQAQQIEASTIMAHRLSDNATQALTTDDFIARFPVASADASRVAFTTLDGQIYIMNLSK